MKYIKRKSAVKPITGSIVDTTNIDDKTKNTYSANIIDKFNTYSTEETFTGKYWIDSKPIYRKVLDIGNLPNATSKSIAHNISNLNYFTDMYAVAFASTEFITIPYAHTTAGSSIYLYANKTDLQIRAETDRSGFVGYVILEYTKTTD